MSPGPVLLTAGILAGMTSCAWPPEETRADTDPMAPSTMPGADLSGFRADRWFLPDDELLGFVEIPAGPFAMGSDAALDPLAYENELWPGARGPTTVEVETFYIGRHEVTVAQYRAFVEATGHDVAPEALEAPPDHPVTSISWPDALACCRWLEATLRKWPHTPRR